MNNLTFFYKKVLQKFGIVGKNIYLCNVRQIEVVNLRLNKITKDKIIKEMSKQMKLNELDLMDIQDEFEKSGIDFDINEYREEEDAEVAADLVKYDITIEEYDEVSRLLDLYEEGTDINDMLKGMSKGQQECFNDYARALNTVWEKD